MPVTVEQRQVFAVLDDPESFLYLQVNDTPTYAIELRNTLFEPLRNPGLHVRVYFNCGSIVFIDNN